MHRSKKYLCRLYTTKKNSRTYQRLNLNNRTLTFAGVDNWPFLGLDEKEEKYYLREGIDVSIIHVLAELFHFKLVHDLQLI